MNFGIAFWYLGFFLLKSPFITVIFSSESHAKQALTEVLVKVIGVTVAGTFSAIQDTWLS